MAPPVTFESERTCCDREEPIRFRSDASDLKQSWTGVWVRSACCGKIHHADRLDAGATTGGAAEA